MKLNIFQLGIFSFNLYVYYLTRGFIDSTRAFNLLARAFNLPTRAFNLATLAFILLTRGFELATRRFELVTRNSCFTFPFWRVTPVSYLLSDFSTETSYPRFT